MNNMSLEIVIVSIIKEINSKIILWNGFGHYIIKMNKRIIFSIEKNISKANKQLGNKNKENNI